MNLTKTYTIDTAKKTLENYCVYQERSHKDVTQKLRSMQMIPEAIDIIVVHLLSHDFLNESRFATAFVSGKFRIKKWGRRRLLIELKKHEISQYIINEAFKEISETDYLNTFHELADKRIISVKETNLYKKKKKVADYLLYRGWESHLVYDKVYSIKK